MKRKAKQFSELYRHEVYDRTFVVLHMWELVEDHPVVIADKELSAEAEKVSEAICDFYRKAAGKLISLSEQTEEPEDEAHSRATKASKKRKAGRWR